MGHPLTLEAFAAWCETKPADEAYVWPDHNICACAQYAEAAGLASHWDKYRNSLLPPDSFWDTADNAAMVRPHTFGALAARLREASK